MYFSDSSVFFHGIRRGICTLPKDDYTETAGVIGNLRYVYLEESLSDGNSRTTSGTMDEFVKCPLTLKLLDNT